MATQQGSAQAQEHSPFAPIAAVAVVIAAYYAAVSLGYIDSDPDSLKNKALLKQLDSVVGFSMSILICGFIGYMVKRNLLFYYSLFELAFGITYCAHALHYGDPLVGIKQKSTFTFVCGVYIVIRGFDNLGNSLKQKPKTETT